MNDEDYLYYKREMMEKQLAQERYDQRQFAAIESFGEDFQSIKNSLKLAKQAIEDNREKNNIESDDFEIGGAL